jgi:hypothetical protein
MGKNKSIIGPDAETQSTQPIKHRQPPVSAWAKLVRAVNRQGGVPTDEQLAEGRRILAALKEWSEWLRT